MKNSQTQPSLLERLRDGTDALAWDEFFGRYWRLIFTFARRRGCSDDTAEEIVQDVMLTVFQQQDVFRYDPTRGRFRDWLGTVALNKVAEHRRRPAQRIRPGAWATPPEPADNHGTPENVWESTFEDSLLTILLDVVRHEVNPRTYQAFELSALGELSGREVARLTGLSRNAVYLARRAVMKRLAALAGGYRDEGRLSARVKQALADLPAPRAERSVTTRLGEARPSLAGGQSS
ncbi:MAG: sigma-70 family RNA polymerase sigma factor [Pirellulales bacterium]|nr:sigma-70 family RNA polymerase sigma factor [Pirellulales bacterium]